MIIELHRAVSFAAVCGALLASTAYGTDRGACAFVLSDIATLSARSNARRL